MDLYSLCQQLEATPIGVGIKNSTWLFPAIEAVHLLALALVGGALLMLDLRLIGVGLTGQANSAVERSTRPWLIGAILTMITTGGLIGFSEALKLLDRKAFTVKMIALVSLSLWLTVALAGRWLGFS